MGNELIEMEKPEERAEFITHLLAGNSSMARGDFDGAVNEYHKALSLNPKFALISGKLGEAYYKSKNYDESVKYFKRALEQDPQSTETLYRLGKAYGEMGMPIQAAVAFDLVRERDKEGDFEDRIEDTQRRIKHRSSHREGRRVSPGAVLGKSLSIIAAHPAVLLPVFAAAAALYLFTPLVSFLTTLVFKHGAAHGLTAYLLNPQLSLNMRSLAVCISQVLFLSLFYIPLLCIVIAVANRVVRAREISMGEAIEKITSNYSTIIALSLEIGIAIIAFAAVSVFLLKTFSLMILEFTRINLSLIPLLIPTLLIPVSYVIYLYPGVIVDRRGISANLKKTGTFASRYFLWTYMLLLIYAGAEIGANYVTGAKGGFPYAILRIPATLLQTYLITVLTVTYSFSQKPGHHKHRVKKPAEEVHTFDKYERRHKKKAPESGSDYSDDAESGREEDY